MQLTQSWKFFVATTFIASATVADRQPAATENLAAIAEEAYIYGFPLLVMDATKRQMTNVATPRNELAPINQFGRVESLPDASFKAVVRPNVDTLYTIAFLDLAKEPIVLHVPDTNGRYYLMPMLDAYTNVFAAPGKRTSGTKEQTIVIAGPGWKGTLPAGLTKIQAPTNMVWIIGRTQINGKEDLPKVVALTRQYTLTPLSAHGKPYTPPKITVDPNIDMKAKPPETVAAMETTAYFERLARLMIENPPPPRDRPALARFAKLGLAPGRFAPSPDARQAIATAPERARTRILAATKTFGTTVNGWRVATDLGSYDTRYLDRAAIALAGLGANLAEDAIYPVTFVDDKNQPLTGERSYVLHFAKGQEPPVNAFWSLTMYDRDGYFVANPINRYAIGNRDKLQRNADGSLDIVIQHAQPSGAENWLPAPTGPFNLALRLYWPKESVLAHAWKPPAITSATPQVGQTE